MAPALRDNNVPPGWCILLHTLPLLSCQNKMQVDQEDQKYQAGDKEEKKSETEEMEVNEPMDRLRTKMDTVCDLSPI